MENVIYLSANKCFVWDLYVLVIIFHIKLHIPVSSGSLGKYHQTQN
jgi:hypothetical protein